MKYIVLIPDGASDYPLEELDGKTPLEYANMPNVNKLVSRATIGLAQTIPQGFTPGSDVANLSILSYDPNKYYSGRGPLEAAHQGIKLSEADFVFRCNLVTVKDGYLIDYSASHIDTKIATSLINDIREKMNSKIINFYAGVSYRHLTVFKNTPFPSIKTIAPHDALDEPIEKIWPKGENAELLKNLIKQSTSILENHPLNKKRIKDGLNPANMIWFWGGGQKKSLPSFPKKFGLRGSVISAVDLIKGLAVSAGLKVADVPTATGYFDTDYEAKARKALSVLKDNDFVYIHIEAADEAGHIGDIKEKVKALENFDKRLLKILLDNLDLNQARILLLPDHATPVIKKTHTSDAVPFMIFPGNGEITSFNEKEAYKSKGKVVLAHELMQKLVSGHK